MAKAVATQTAVTAIPSIEDIIVAICKQRFDNPTEYRKLRKQPGKGGAPILDAQGQKQYTIEKSQIVPVQEFAGVFQRLVQAGKADPKYADTRKVGVKNKKGEISQREVGSIARVEFLQSMVDRGLIKSSWGYQGPAYADLRYVGGNGKSSADINAVLTQFGL